MGKHTRKPQVADEPGRTTLGELIHAAVRRAIEAAVDEELAGALGADRYEREAARRGYRNGTKERTLTGPTGPVRPPCARHPAPWPSSRPRRLRRRRTQRANSLFDPGQRMPKGPSGSPPPS